MAFYYSASERAFFSSELMSVDAMPADRVSVTDSAYKQLMADQVAGKLIRTGSGNAPESVDQGLAAATRFGDVSFGKVTSTSIDLNGSGDVSGSWTVHGTLNAQGGLTVTDITATGTTTVVGLNAGNISASGTLAVNGNTTMTGKLTANGGVSTKALTATSLDLNGNGDVSGTLAVHGKTTLEDVQANGDVTVGGLLQVTGETTLRGGIRHETNFWQKRTKSTISVGDTERDSQNEIIYRIVDKNNATLMSEEAYFNADGSRDLRFNGRNRANDAWRLFLTIKEFANEEVRIIAADSPISSLNDHTLVTAKWVNEKNFAKDSSVVHLSGNETISDKKTFTYPISVAASTGFEVVRTDQDLKTIPSSDVQTWYGRYKDKNNLSGLLIKHYQRESGETSVSLTDINYYHTDDNNGDWSSLTIGHNPDGTRYIKAFYDPIDSINEYEVITAKWLRKYIWNPDGAQVVHTVNDESISGVKTFTRSISVSANPLIQSSHWTGISVFDSTRSNGSQKILAQVLDKDGKRFISLEVSANTDGGRTLHINGRNREDSWWTTLAKFTEKGDGTIVGELGGSPVTDSHFSPPNFAVFSSTKVGQALALGTSASVLTCSKKPCRSREIEIHASTVSTTLEVIAPKPHQISSDVQVIASLIGARHATADNVSKAHFGCFERRLMICQERSGH